jgi:hypothetical protein
MTQRFRVTSFNTTNDNSLLDDSHCSATFNCNKVRRPVGISWSGLPYEIGQATRFIRLRSCSPGTAKLFPITLPFTFEVGQQPHESRELAQ